MKNLEDLINSSKESGLDDSDIDSEDLDQQTKKLANHRYSSDTNDRKWLAKWTAVVVSIWLVGVMVILMLNELFFCLTEGVLISLLGTTTLNVLGLSFIVLRGHFKTVLNN